MAILAVEHHPLAHSVSSDTDSLIVSLIHWRQLDGDLSVNGLLLGNQGRR
jgi:hypothetical protein